MNLVAQCHPTIEWPLAEAMTDLLSRSIDCHPRHHLRMREIASRAAHLPDSFVRLLPTGFQEIHQRSLKAPRIVVAFQFVLSRDVQRVDYLAVDVELKLLMRGVANTHCRTFIIARKPWKLYLMKHAIARN